MSAPLYPVLTGLQQTSFQPAPPPGSQFAPTLIIHGQQPIVIPSQQPILPVSHPHEYPNHQPWTPGGVQTTSFITPPPPPPSSQPPTAPRESALYKDDLSILPVETNHETRGTNYKDIHTVNVEKSVVVHVSRETQTVGLEFGYDGTVAFPKPNDKVVPNKKGKVLTVLGALQIVIGIILILDNVGIISISKQFTRYFAPGIWGGIMVGCRVITSQRPHDATITSFWRQNDVATSFWRHNDVIFASCVRRNTQKTNVCHDVTFFVVICGTLGFRYDSIQFQCYKWRWNKYHADSRIPNEKSRLCPTIIIISH